MLQLKNVHKKIYAFSTVAALTTLLYAGTVFAGTRAYCNDSAVNVRQDAGTGSEVLGKLDEKEEVEILGKESNFIRINFNGEDGYVREDFITIESVEAFANDDNVNVRANSGKEVIGQLNTGDVITVTGRFGDFLVFDYDGEIGFVNKNYVDCAFKASLPEIKSDDIPVTYAEVISDTSLNLREEPNTTASVLASLPKGDILDVIAKNGEWTKVRTYNDITGYVSSEFVDVKTGVKPERPAASKGLEIIDYAKQFLGTPYVYGGTSLKSGVDCSGFVYSVFRNFGITLNRSSSTMPADGVKISKGELVAGDLVFFTNGGAGNIQHVGIYCGDGTFIHSASGGNMRVMISGMDEDYYVRNYITAARILN